MAKEITVKVFTFSELSAEVKKEIIERERWNVMANAMDCYDSDYECTLASLESATGFRAKNWSVDYCSYSVTAALSDGSDNMFNYMDETEICGKHLFRYVNRNIIPNLYKGKWFSLCWNSKTRTLNCSVHHTRDYRSKITMEPFTNCVLTGMCYEVPFIQKLVHYINNWTKYPENYSLQDLMNDCYDAFFKAWHEEYEYWADNDEAIEGELTENGMYEDRLYYEDGSLTEEYMTKHYM